MTQPDPVLREPDLPRTAKVRPRALRTGWTTGTCAAAAAKAAVTALVTGVEQSWVEVGLPSGRRVGFPVDRCVLRPGGPDPDPDPKPKPKLDLDLDSEPDPKPKPKLDLDLDLDSEPDSEPEPDSGLDPEPEPDSVTGGWFGVVRALRARGVVPVVLPAVSSVVHAFARAGLSWDDAVVVSAHGRALRPAVNACRARPKVAVLTGPGAGPAELGAALAGTGRTLVIAEDLGGDEQVTWCRADEAAGRTWRDPNVVLCLAAPDSPLLDGPDVTAGGPGWVAGGAPRPAGWALPETEFAHRAGMITKSEVRAVALARLAPRLGELVWDVGAGSGAVGVECARRGAAVIAVDRDPEACALVFGNAAAFGVDVTVVPGTAPAALAGLPRPDAVFVGGGGADVAAVVAAAVAAGADRVVVSLAAAPLAARCPPPPVRDQSRRRWAARWGVRRWGALRRGDASRNRAGGTRGKRAGGGT